MRTNTIQLEDIGVVINGNEKDEQFLKLNECIQKLEEVDRSIILLHLEDLPYKEIAQIIGMTENHVAVKIKRIKNKLLTCLKS